MLLDPVQVSSGSAPVHQGRTDGTKPAQIDRSSLERHQFNFIIEGCARCPAFDAIEFTGLASLLARLPGCMKRLGVFAKDQHRLSVIQMGQARFQPSAHCPFGNAHGARQFIDRVGAVDFDGTPVWLRPAHWAAA
ncbi:MAG: hypothetical protein CMJ15_09870 [Pelagibacterium sp.]|nr:hypothetical protein [Pelagibacterium sp.]